MISRFEKFSYAISEISRYWHKIAADEMAKYGLKGPYAVYFTTLYRFEEGLTSAKLAEVCGRDKADVSRAMTVMEQKGLVKKIAIGQSGYRAKLKLTEEGTEAARHINQRAAVAVELGGKGYSEEHRRIFYEVLDIIADNLHSLSEDGLPL